jgi:hypothetical protein
MPILMKYAYNILCHFSLIKKKNKENEFLGAATTLREGVANEPPPEVADATLGAATPLPFS